MGSYVPPTNPELGYTQKLGNRRAAVMRHCAVLSRRNRHPALHGSWCETAARTRSLLKSISKYLVVGECSSPGDVIVKPNNTGRNKRVLGTPAKNGKERGHPYCQWPSQSIQRRRVVIDSSTSQPARTRNLPAHNKHTDFLLLLQHYMTRATRNGRQNATSTPTGATRRRMPPRGP